MIQRNVTGRATFDAQRYAHQAGLHGIQRGGFRIDGHLTGIFSQFDPFFQTLDGGDTFIVDLVGVQFFGLGAVGFGQLTPRMGNGFHLQRAKPVMLQKRQQFFQINIRQAKTIHIRQVRHIQTEGDQITADAGLIGKFDQVLTAFRLFDLFGPGQQAVQITIFFDQQRGGFHTNARHTGHVIGAVPGERLHINDFFRTNTEFLVHLIHPDMTVFHAVQHGDFVIDQLHQVFIGRNDGHLMAFGGGAAGIGGDHIIGFITAQFDGGHVKGFDRFPDDGKLRDQVFRGRWTVSFVIGVDIVAECLAGRIKNHRQMGGFFLIIQILNQFEQHVGKAHHRINRCAFRVGQRG